MSKNNSTANNAANMQNANKGTSGTNTQNAQNEGNRGKQMNPNQSTNKKSQKEGLINFPEKDVEKGFNF